MEKVFVIDSHTGGEPTRTILSGGPDLGSGPLSERRTRFDLHAARFRQQTLWEPRAIDALVGAILLEPHDARCRLGVLFYNTVGSLGMCGHGTIGLAVTLAYLQRLPLGIHQMDTPVGPVQLELHDTHTVSIQNVPSYRLLANVTVELPGFGPVVGDVAWGGNWFFHTSTLPVPLELRHAIQLQDYCWKVRRALSQAGITGEHGAEIDHIMLLDEPKDPQNHRRNFTLCPGGAFDRSPCGTGTSALVACLAAEQQLAPGATWRQESITGSVFQASYQQTDQGIIPTIRGQAYITAETTLIFESSDPLREGYQR